MSERRIVVCGGGDPTTSARPHFESGLQMTGVTAPNILLLTTAAPTSEAYWEVTGAVNEYGNYEGLDVRVLHTFSDAPTREHTSQLLEWADAIVIADGNFERLRQVTRDTFTAELIREAVDKGSVVAIGMGAGGAWLFDQAFTDTDKYDASQAGGWKFKDLSGLGVLRGICCTDYDGVHPIDKHRVATLFMDYMRTLPQGAVGIGIPTHMALVLNGATVSVAAARGSGTVQRLVVGPNRVISGTTYLPGDTEPINSLLPVPG